MKFTDRYIKVPIMVHDIAEKNIMGKEVNAESWYKFNPFELAGYRPSYSSERPDEEIVSMELKSGETTLVYLCADEFEKLLNEHQK